MSEASSLPANDDDSPGAVERPPRRFDGKTALITGVSERGIGAAIAERLAFEGASVALVTRREPKRVMKKIGRLHARAAFLPCDVTQPDQVRRSVEQTLAQFVRLDIVVNNAGVEIARHFDDFQDDEWRNIIAVNLVAAIDVTRAVLPHLRKTKGVIVNIASALALGGAPGFSIYSASKAGLIGLTQSLGWELGPQGVRVVGVAPGMVHTPMIHKHIGHISMDLLRQIEASHPLGMGLPRDVASAVAFLASEDARWITGVTLPLGWTGHYSLPVEQFMEKPVDSHSTGPSARNA
jgi:NAD(P)-dependent dehydrogenase (short-subunit alcohol dehydrogenase family)